MSVFRREGGVGMIEPEITKAVSERYAKAVTTGEQMCCPTGYNFDDLRSFVPEEVLRVSYGCGTPAGLATVKQGETVLDIGSGGGIDCFDAARRVGPSGRVLGVDMTDEMLVMARRNAPVVAANLGYPSSNVEFRKGHAENLPVEDASIDLIISNCVINLAPDKKKVFREMFRVIRPGGRFTISDIVADQPVPQYLIHDAQKWGDCLSGALPAWDYLAGLVQAGFLGVHQMKFFPWSVIDGIHFFSLTLTGFKLPETAEPNGTTFATLLGPFSRAVDELGQTYHRGRPEPVSARAAQLLNTPPFERLFLLSDRPISLATTDQRLVSILPADAPCAWKGQYAILTAPFAEAEDDDHHVYRRGVPLEICSKTQDVLESGPYSPHFAVINRAGEAVSGNEVSCDPGGSCC
jgi:SAM-dependent methyltransferase